MKRGLLFLIFIAICMVCHAQQSLIQAAKSTIKPLTAIDMENYVMTIDPIAVRNYNRNVMFLPVKFTNNSNDTLRYLTMSCSWEDFYITNAVDVATIPLKVCQKNIPDVLILGPRKSTIKAVPIIRQQGHKKFRVGMKLIKANKNDSLIDLFNLTSFPIDRKDDNIIWSNPIELP